MIVATAGHVDHGKTSLVKAITGVETDRLPEEKARGLTILPGFAYLAHQSGKTIGFIDVPGHERFVRNMVAGVSAVDLALLVVATDDGIMPQTREHTAILSLLGVSNVIVALTKADRVSADRVARVSADISRFLDQLGMNELGCVATVAPDGTGVAEVISLIAQFDAVTRGEEPGTGFRLAIDRAFVVSGAGTVVTGTVHAGTVNQGDELDIMPRQDRVRVRSIHVQDRKATRATRGDRAALNLTGIDSRNAGYGDWVVSRNLLGSSTRIDTELHHLAAVQRDFRTQSRVHIHHGTGHVTGRVALLEASSLAPGSSGLARLVTDTPLVAAHGDRIVIRDEAARRTIAGCVVLDVNGSARGQARPDRLAYLHATRSHDTDAALSSAISMFRNGIDVSAFLTNRNISPDTRNNYTIMGQCMDYRVGHAVFTVLKSFRNCLASEIVATVQRDHAERHDRAGKPANELHRDLSGRWSRPLVEIVLREMVRAGTLARRGIVYHLPGHSVQPGEQDRELWERCSSALDASDGTPTSLFPLARDLELDPEFLRKFLERMLDFGIVVRIRHNRFVTPDVLESAAATARSLCEGSADGFSVGDFRDRSGYGRNFVIDLLEYLDKHGVTERKQEFRTIVRISDDRRAATQ